MSFRDNLQHLRATRNMTQEQLAMLLGVSRQSVSKWEAERAYPEMDKLLKLCDLFGCTLDDLVTGDLTGREPEPALALDPAAAPTDVCGYDEVMLRTSHRIAAGVGVILLGVGASGFLAQAPSIAPRLSHDFGPAIALFGGIAVGLLLIIPAAFERSAFQRAHPFVEDFYTADQRMQAQIKMGRGIATGVALIMAALALGAAFGGKDEQMAVLSFFAPLGLGVGLIVDAALVATRMNISEYNDDALAELTDEEIEALDDPDLARRARASKRDDALYGAIMLGATIIALFWLFCGEPLGFSDLAMSVFWVPWPLGGLACALVATLRKLWA